MFRTIRRRLTFANVVSLMALFFAVGGSAYAAVVVTSNDDVAPDTIAGHKPGPGKHANLILGSVNNEDLAPETVKTGRITDGTVGVRDLGTDSVDRSKVAADAIGPDELGPDSVGSSELEGAVFYDVTGTATNDPVGGPPSEVALADFGGIHVFGRCNESSPGTVTAKVILRADGIAGSLDTTAPGGVDDAGVVAPGTE